MRVSSVVLIFVCPALVWVCIGLGRGSSFLTGRWLRFACCVFLPPCVIVGLFTTKTKTTKKENALNQATKFGKRILFDDHPTRAVFDTKELPTDDSHALYRVYLRSWQRHSCRPGTENTPIFDVICPTRWCRWITHISILNYLDGISWLAWPVEGGVSWRHRTIDPYSVHYSTDTHIPVIDLRKSEE